MGYIGEAVELAELLDEAIVCFRVQGHWATILGRIACVDRAFALTGAHPFRGALLFVSQREVFAALNAGSGVSERRHIEAHGGP